MAADKIIHPLGWTDKELQWLAESNRDKQTGKVINISMLYRSMGYKLKPGNPVPRGFIDRVYGLLDTNVTKG